MRIARQVIVTMVAVAALTVPVTGGTAAADVQRGRAVQRPARAVPRPAARPPVRAVPRPTVRPRARAMPRPAVRRPARAVRAPARRVWVGAGLYRPYYFTYYHPWDPFYGPYGYGPWRYPYYPYDRYGASGAVRLQVSPRETEVFVDGYYVGVVDSFDGFFQRLRLPPGNHEIELYLAGHESIRQTLYMTPGQTYRIRHVMVPLVPGAPVPPRPAPASAAPPSTVGGPSTDPPPASGAAVADPVGFGTLVVRVQPVDAAVVIDGERWTGHEAVGELVLDLGAGTYRLEVSRDGHRPYGVDVDIAPGEDTLINVSLPPADSEGK